MKNEIELVKLGHAEKTSEKGSRFEFEKIETQE